MVTTPRPAPEGEQSASCPYCTLQIPAETLTCPHCRRELPPRENGRGTRRRPGPAERVRDVAGFLSRYGLWLKVGGPILLAALVLVLVYGSWVRIKVEIVPNASLPVTVRQEKRDKTIVLTGTVTNEGDDVPDFSLKSIGVVVEIRYADGRAVRKTVFPKSEFRGEGSLLRGESGTFEVEAPAKGVTSVVFQSEIVDLGMGRTLVPPGARGTIPRSR